MSFLQPSVLWGLPLLVVPVLVHLLNRMRYRTVPWAAMMFLRVAMRQSTRQARLREWLVLACRMLAVAALVVAFARPLVGGWFGWMISGPPDSVVLLLDRSASMEVRDPATQLSKRVLALRRMAEAGGVYGGGTRFVLVESALREPQELAGVAALETVRAAAATDSAADIPALLEAGLDYVVSAGIGRVELWLASDFQRSNWQPDSRRWETVRARLRVIPQDLRVRLLGLTAAPAENVAVAVRNVERRRSASGQELVLTVELTQTVGRARTLPLTIVHEGARSVVNVEVEGSSCSVQVALELGGRKSEGWGWVEVPADANPRDNTAYFAYPEERQLKTVVVVSDPAARRVLGVAAAPSPSMLSGTAEPVESVAGAKLDDVAMLIWQGDVVAAVKDFAEDGGVVVAFPAEAEEEGKFRVGWWRRTDGVLANTRDGWELPLDELEVRRRRLLRVAGTVVAAFADGKPFLVKQPVGKGAIYWCATLPVAEWSNLADGMVLVPMLQRILREGGRRLGKADSAEVGAALPGAMCLTGAQGRVATDAGVYRVGGKVVAVNRPAVEDDPEIMDEDAVRALFEPVVVRMLTEKGGRDGARLQSEVWRWFLVAALLALTAEAVLALPGQVREWAWKS